MEHAKEAIRRTLADVKVYLSQDSPRKISEADTKANFIEPLVAALGWEGIGVVTREYYVKDSQEFIDYVMFGPNGPLLAIEAKSLQTPLTDKFAAQLIQYCAVQGIEWAALTNGRDLQFFNTFLKPDLSAKRILQLDLLAFNSDAEYDALFENIWQLSRESMTTTKGVHAWLHQRRLDQSLRDLLLNPSSSTIRHLRRALASTEIKATPQEISQWFRSHLGIASSKVPIPQDQTKETMVTTGESEDLQGAKKVAQEVTTVSADLLSQALVSLQQVIRARWGDTVWRVTKHYEAASADGQTFIAVKRRSGKLLIGLSLPADSSYALEYPNQGEFNWGRVTGLYEASRDSDLDEKFLQLADEARTHALDIQRGHSHYGVQLSDLLNAGLLDPGARLILTSGKREIAEAVLSHHGTIVHNNSEYTSPSSKIFAQLIAPNRTSLNGWTHWLAEGKSGRKRLADYREQYLKLKNEIGD